MVSNEAFNVSRRHLFNCSLPAWYSTFRTKTFATRILPLPQEFVEYLKEDGIRLLDTESESDILSSLDEDDSRQLIPLSTFSHLIEQIWQAIHELGGAVLPKLNWSSPKDAVFMSYNRSLKCTTVNDVLVLLKSSDFIIHDLDHVWDECIDQEPVEDFQPCLVLREFMDAWNPAMEFRCFVRDGQLIAACQRDIHTSYNHLSSSRGIIVECLFSFFSSMKFYETNFAFDLYLSNSMTRATLIDINPWCHRTDTLLFDWNELQSSDVFSFKLTSDDTALLKPSNIHSYYGYPVKDLLYLAKDQGVSLDIENLVKKMNSENAEKDS